MIIGMKKAAAASSSAEGNVRPQQGGERGLRVLHLGFEDPMMPGAGGGSVRTHEMNRRMAERGHRITVLTTRYPGWSERVQDGVHYIPIGFGQGKNRLTRLAGYVLRLPVETRRRAATADLVVEDFFAPFSTMAAPLWTGRPTIGVVQWLHAEDKSRQYKLPLHLIERAGVRRHRRAIAVSRGTADKLARLNPRLHVTVIGNGIDPIALETKAQRGRDVVSIGRLELPGKGLDLLLTAWAKACSQIDGDLVIAGSGPDEERIRRMIDDMGLSGTVHLTGWVRGVEKFQLLSSARLVVVPSRQETFGLVAIEALASATPIIAFDIPCLKEVVPAGCGWLVVPFDADRLADEMVAHYDAANLEDVGSRGRRWASALDWDLVADLQIQEYRQSVSELGKPGGTRIRVSRVRHVRASPPPSVRWSNRESRPHEL
jgi:glycosyltransferase involved in cell wall biosynthesis